MIPVQISGHPPGTVGIPAGETARYTSFTQSLASLRVPEGTQLAVAQGISVTRNLNEICSSVIGDWLWIVGDDHVFDDDVLMRLLARRLPIVVPLCYLRRPPALAAFRKRTAEGYVTMRADELPERGTVAVEAAGTAGMLIRREVLDAIESPTWRTSDEEQNEDLVFCGRVREAGFEIALDVEVAIGHITPVVLWPVSRFNSRCLRVDFGGGAEVFIP